MSFEFFPAGSHPVLPKRMLSSFLDFRNPLHRVDSGLHKFAVITNRDIPAFLKIDSRIDNHLLPCSLSESLGPLNFTRVSFHFEILMAF